jgi:hypothetical protein
MNIVTKAAGVVLAAAALCGIGASAALAATPTGHAPHAAAGSSSTSPSPSSRVGAPLYSRGFHIYNLTTTPWTLESISGDNNFEGVPAIGSVLQPGQYADFEVQYKFLSDQNDDVVYRTTNSDVDVELSVDGDGNTYSKTMWSAGPDQADTNGTTINLVEEPGTTITYDGSQAQQQAAVLNQMCAGGVDATCTFTPTSETHVDGPQHQVGDSFTNASKVEADYKITEADTVGISDSVGISATAGANLFGIVDASISASYNHEWTTSHEFDESMNAHVPAMTKVWLEDAPQMIRDTGNFQIVIGNTTINVIHVYFDSPDPSGNGNWTLMSQSLTGGPIHKTALH